MDCLKKQTFLQLCYTEGMNQEKASKCLNTYLQLLTRIKER